LDTLNILRNGLPVPTSYIQFLKSRNVPALSLFNFCRYRHNRMKVLYPPHCGGYLTPYIPTAEAAGFTALFGKSNLLPRNHKPLASSDKVYKRLFIRGAGN